MNTDNVIIRRAVISDAPEICRLIRSLAEFERMGEKFRVSPEVIVRMMSDENGLRGIIAEKDGRTAGIAAYTTYRLAGFSGRRVVYLEDIFIEEEMRGCGIGRMIFEELKKAARELDAVKIEWKCLAWNENARRFYEKMGGSSDDEWLTYTAYL